MDVALVVTASVLSGIAWIFSRQTARYARQAWESQERAQAAYEEIKRMRGTR